MGIPHLVCHTYPTLYLSYPPYLRQCKSMALVMLLEKTLYLLQFG